MSRGCSYDNFLTVDVSDDKLQVRIYNEYGEERKWNAQYKEAGHLTIDKSSSSGTEISSSGLLQLIDLDIPIISFDFEEILPLGTRQVIGFRSAGALMATEVEIRNRLCNESMSNNGGFGAQYDSQVGGITLVEGVNGGKAGSFTSNSRMAIQGK